MTDDDVLIFWGKTRPHGDPRHKPLLHHLLDVAAVALQWQRANPTALAREAALLAGRPEHVVKTAAFLVAMHDVGKVSRGFQAKVPDLWPQRRARPEGARTRSRSLAQHGDPPPGGRHGRGPEGVVSSSRTR